MVETKIAPPPSPDVAAARIRAATEARCEAILEQAMSREASVRAAAEREAVETRAQARSRRRASEKESRLSVVAAVVVGVALLAGVAGWKFAAGGPAPLTQMSDSPAAQSAVDAGRCPIPAVYRSAFVSASRKEGVPLSLLTSVASVESGWQPRAVSARGAIGLMQMLRSTAAYLHVDPYDWRENVRGGARFLRLMLAQYHGNTELALSAYNAGPYRVSQGNVPIETVVYVGAVMAQQARIVGCR